MLEKIELSEAFLLSAAACCHDFDKGLKSANLILQGFFHGKGSGEFVVKNATALGLSIHEAKAICSAIAIHDLKGNEFSRELGTLKRKENTPWGPINLQRVAVVLKTADILHCDYTRVLEIGIDSGKLEGLERAKHLTRSCTKGWDIDGSRILLQADPDSVEKMEAFRKGFDYMRKEEWSAVADDLDRYGFPFKLELDDSTLTLLQKNDSLPESSDADPHPSPSPAEAASERASVGETKGVEVGDGKAGISLNRKLRAAENHKSSKVNVDHTGKTKTDAAISGSQDNGVKRNQPAPVVRFPEPNVTSANLESFRNKLGTKPVLLMTAVPIELQAARSLMRPFPGEDAIYRCYEDKETYYGGVVEAHAVVLTMCGMGASSRDGIIGAAHDAIKVFEPCAVVMPGMAFGADSGKQRLGDVMVATQVIAYELSRVGADTTISRGAHSEAGGVLLNRFRNVSVDWDACVENRRVEVRFGPILSGEKLIDNKEFKNKLLAEFPKAIGGEMEGHGLYAAAARRDMEWIVVKGVADWADGTKTKGWQPFAALAAAKLVEEVLSDAYRLSTLHASVIGTGAANAAGNLSQSAFESEQKTDIRENQALDETTGNNDSSGIQHPGSTRSKVSALLEDRLKEKTDGDPLSDFSEQAVERTGLIMTEAMADVIKALNSNKEPFRSLRRAILKKLETGDAIGPEINLELLEDTMKNRLRDLLTAIALWLEDQGRLSEADKIQKVVDVLAAAGMDAEWIARMRARLEGKYVKEHGAHIEVTEWTTPPLSEAILSALYDKPAVWASNRHIPSDFIQVEPPGQTLDSRLEEVRKEFTRRVLGHLLGRTGYGSDAAYRDRLKAACGDRLIRTLRQHLLDFKKPYFFLFAESDSHIKKLMNADPELWKVILRMEKCSAQNDVVYEDVELINLLDIIFSKLDNLR